MQYEGEGVGYPYGQVTTIDATPLPPSDVPIEKLGGFPVGLPPDRWPRCLVASFLQDRCAPMHFVGQFVHHPERCDLGREGRWLFVFWCRFDHEIWDPAGGANACVVVEPEELVVGETRIDLEIDDDDASRTVFAPVGRSFRIVSWREENDGLTEPDCAELRRYSSGEADPSVVDKWIASGGRELYLGGTPWYDGGPVEWPAEPWHYLGSIGPVRVIDPLPPTYVATGRPSAFVWPDGSWSAGPDYEGFTFDLWAETSDPDDPFVALTGRH